jgi:ArsR family transcriptional regulator, virulence genes transcriptional regulator
MKCDCKKCCKACNKVKEISHVLKTLAEPNRLRIVCYLLEGSKSAGDIGESLDVPHNLVSFHLKTLLEEDFLTRRKDGNRIYYSIKPEQKNMAENIIDLFK